jgi:hypothetical protein
VEVLRLASLHEPHPRSRERFQALYLIASGRFHATACAAPLGRQDETVPRWAHRYNRHGPAALAYRHSGGRAPFSPAAANRTRRHGRTDRPDPTRPARARLDGQEAQAMGLPGLRRHAGRGTLRRLLRQVGLTWKKVKRLLGKAKPEKRPGYSPDLNPIERLWNWMREGGTRGPGHASVPALSAACRAFIERINRDPLALIDRRWPKFELDPEFEAKLLVSS